jgi:hypothetical protein
MIYYFNYHTEFIRKMYHNSGYWLFGHPYFKYYHPRVADLVTAYGDIY